MRVVVLVVALALLFVGACTGGSAPAGGGKAGDAGTPAAVGSSADQGSVTEKKQSSAPATAKPKELFDLKMGLTGEASFYMPLYVADKRSFFADEGLKVDFVRLGTNDNVPAIVSGSTNITVVSTDKPVRAFLKGSKIRLIANFLEVAPYDLVSLPDIKTPEQLRGGTVGVGTLSGSTAAIVKKYLKAYGLEEKRDYTLVAPGANMERIAALMSRSVQAVLISDPGTFELLDKGYYYLGSIKDKVPHYSFDSFWINQEWAAQHESQVVGFLKAAIRGTDWMYDPANKNDAIKIIADYYNLKPEVATETYELHVEQQQTWTSRLAISEQAIESALDLEVELGNMKPEERPSIDKMSDKRFYERALQALGSK